MDVVFNRVGKRFGQRDALADLSFELQSGEMAFLTGHSGAGKSTLLRLLLLLERASSGDIAVGGTPSDTAAAAEESAVAVAAPDAPQAAVVQTSLRERKRVV